MIRLALFASGTGSNVYNIIQYFKDNLKVEVVAVLSNKENAGALKHAENADIITLVFTKEDFRGNTVLEFLQRNRIDYIILAGFLWKVPENIIQAYSDKILNVHPALLPKYGGKGMYGMHVHKAVVEAKEKESGITIHKVNENYDEGAVVAQFKCQVEVDDTPERLVRKIQQLEKDYFPFTIEKYITKA